MYILSRKLIWTLAFFMQKILFFSYKSFKLIYKLQKLFKLIYFD